MTDLPTPPPIPAIPGGMPSYADTILSVLLMGVIAPLAAKHVIANAEVAWIVWGLVALASLTWAWINANPDRRSPIVFLLSLARRAPAGAQPSPMRTHQP